MFRIGKTVMYIGETTSLPEKTPIVIRKFQRFKLLNVKGGCEHVSIVLDIGFKIGETTSGLVCSPKHRCSISSRPDETRWVNSKGFVPVDEDGTELSHITIDEILEGSLPIFHQLLSHNEKEQQT